MPESSLAQGPEDSQGNDEALPAVAGSQATMHMLSPSSRSHGRRVGKPSRPMAAGNAESEADKFARDRRTEQNACISPSTMTLPMAQSSISKKYLSERQGSPPPQKARGDGADEAMSCQHSMETSFTDTNASDSPKHTERYSERSESSQMRRHRELSRLAQLNRHLHRNQYDLRDQIRRPATADGFVIRPGSRKLGAREDRKDRNSRGTMASTRETGLKKIKNPANLLKRFEASSQSSQSIYEIIEADLNISLDIDSSFTTCCLCGSRVPAFAASNAAAQVHQGKPGEYIHASYVPLLPHNVKEKNVDWELQWTKLLRTEMHNFKSIELFCRAMLTNIDINFPQPRDEGAAPNYLRVAASLDMLDTITPMLGGFQALVSRLRDELVNAIYMPDNNKKTQDVRGQTVIRSRALKEHLEVQSSQAASCPRHLPSSQRTDDSEPMRDGRSYFSRTPYFTTGIRTLNDQVWLREIDKIVKSSRSEVASLQQKVDCLESENTSLEKRIEGFQLRTQTMESEIEIASKKSAKKEASLLKEIETLTLKLDEAMIQSQMATSPGEKKVNTASPEHTIQDLTTQSNSSSIIPVPAPLPASMSVQDLEDAEKRRESEMLLLDSFHALVKGFLEMSRMNVQGLCKEISAISLLFEQSPTVRLLLKSGETSVELNKVANDSPEKLLARWMTAILKDAFKEGVLKEGATVVVNNLTTDLDDGMVLLDFLNLVLPDNLKWPEEKVASAQIACLEKRGELLANAMVDLTADEGWLEVDFFVQEGALENRIRMLSLVFLLSSGITGNLWGACQQLANNKITLDETESRIEDSSRALMKSIEAARIRPDPLAALGPTVGATLCEEAKTLMSNAADARGTIERAAQELSDMTESTVVVQKALTKLYSHRAGLKLQLEMEKCKDEFERGKDEGFQEAKEMGIIHANMQRMTGQSQEFSRNRMKSGFVKLLIGNLNMDRFHDVTTTEFARGVNPEQFVRFMEKCAGCTIQHFNALIKIFRCYGRLKDIEDSKPTPDEESESGEGYQCQATHPTPEGITLRVDNWLSLLHDADLLRSGTDYSKEKIAPLKAVFLFKMACRVKHFHVVDEGSMQGRLFEVVQSVQQGKDNTLNIPGFIEALSRVSWAIMRQLSATSISMSPAETVFKHVAARCDQLDIDHFLLNTSTAKVKDQLKPAVEAALKLYASSDPIAARKSKKSLAPAEFANLLRDCGLHADIDSLHVGWCFWRIDHDVEEEEEEWGGEKEEVSNTNLSKLRRLYNLANAIQNMANNGVIHLFVKSRFSAFLILTSASSLHCQPGRRRLASVSLHRSLCYVACLVTPDPLVPLHLKVRHLMKEYLSPHLLEKK